MARNPWDDDEIVSGNPWDEDEIVSDPRGGAAAPTGIAGVVTQPFAGINRGLDDAFQAVSGAGRLVTDRAFEGVNALAGRQIFDTSTPSARPIQGTQRAVAGQDYNDIPVNNAYDRYAQRIGEEVGASIPAAFGIGLAARGAQATNAVSNATRSGNTGRAVLAPAIQEAARRPGAYMAAEGASAAASGAGAQVARDIAPGNTWAELAGQIAAPMGLFGGSATARAAFRGVGDDARRAAQSAVDDAARAGTTPTAAQLNVQRGSAPIGGTIQNSIGKMPGGGTAVSRRLAQQEDEIAERVSALARGGRRAPATPEDAGQSIKDGIQGYRRRFQGEAEELYNEVDRLIPPETPAPMARARAVAQEILDEGVAGQLGDQVNDRGSRLLAQSILADEPRTYADLSRTRTQIGQMLKDTDLVGTRAEGALKRLYGALTEDVAEVAREPVGARAFHASLQQFNEYDPSRLVWMSTDATAATEHAGRNTGRVVMDAVEGMNIRPERVNLENAFDATKFLEGGGQWEVPETTFLKFVEEMARQAQNPAAVRQAYQAILDSNAVILSEVRPIWQFWSGGQARAAFESALRAGGFDGVRARSWGEETIAAFPNRVESDIAARANSRSQQALTRANEFYRDGASRLEDQLQPLLRGDRADVPEQLFRAVERGGKDGATRVRELRFAMGDEQWDDVSSAVLDRLGRATPGQQDAEGTAFSAETFLTNWNRVFSDEAKDAFFGTSEQQFRKDLDAIARTLSRRRDAARILANPPGTAAAAANIGGITAVGGLLAAQQPAAAAGVAAGFGALYGAGDLITRPWFARWAAQAIEGPTERMPTYLARLAATAQMSGTPEEQERVNRLIEQSQNQGQQRGGDYRQQ